jgi:hypothetical protein
MEPVVTEKITLTSRAKYFVERHKVGITATATSAFWLALQVRTSKAFNEFLQEKDLYDEYYNDPDEE